MALTDRPIRAGHRFPVVISNETNTPLSTSGADPSLLPVDMIYQLFSTVGDGSGTTEQAAAAAIYKVSAPAGWKYYINRMNVYVEDNSKFRGDRYGGTAALASGIVVSVENGVSQVKDLTPQPIQVIGHWALPAGIDMFITDYTAGDETAFVRWTFSKGGGPIILNGNFGEFLQMNIQDNLGAGGAALVSHIAEAQGYRKAI